MANRMEWPHNSNRNRRISSFIDRFRDKLSHHDALPQMVILGVLSGLAAALLIVAFRWLIETPLALAFGANVDDFESLPPLLRFAVPFAGALLLGAALSFVQRQYQSVSVSHVLEQLHNNRGRLPAMNIAVQFFGGIVALASGQSVGKEGPGIHLGAGVASQLGQYFKLPDNAMRTLVACGAAAGIAASFNTPMAGVVFAMEVILMEYTITGFIPVILASVLGATINQLVFGTELSFVAVNNQGSLVSELPFMVASGFAFALTAAAFIRLHLYCLQRNSRPIWQRYLLIGVLTGTVAIYVPQILGTGYDTLNQAISNSLELRLLFIIVIAKLIVTAVATGLGMVGGIIGPTLMIGGCLGAIMGWVGNSLVSTASEPGFYVVLGMVAMMGAVLNAPLAALIAILELSHNPGILFPAMLLVVVACVGVQTIFSYRGIFAEQLNVKGHDLHAETGKGFLSRVGVRSAMNRSFHIVSFPLSMDVIRQQVASESIWLVIKLDANGIEEASESNKTCSDENQSDIRRQVGLCNNFALVATADLARLLDSEQHQLPDEILSPYVLDELGIKLFDLALIDSLASLHNAGAVMRDSSAEVLIVVETHYIAESRILGIITRATLENYYGL